MMTEKNTQELKIDRLSFQLGMINCFVEMVACGVKKLALSPPLLPQDYQKIEKASTDLVNNFNIKSYLEKSLMVTDLQTEDFTRGKWSILYFRTDDVLQKYLELKQKQKELKESGKYDKTTSKEISREFMRLLSYPDNIIEEKLSKTTPTSPFMLVE
ncbi:MAG: hypothetical protein GTO45_25810 [Candidatus Aminicenantes bacterium]|nr:hypothetical protein [Candidatus Aminicenantes bacterium]NIM82155.1 hypothetical protein [Candidatus Aminicenantes bacterium]NIN21556.1 hypothetical protein [Candidatus Aminicenantes bacterium]NIN45365.1 hypothetical protein [Candidatus Aminicenantes bacterium]NIN88186.1 hypothetical protein [Candidatus Aminicenantes bacterium]